MAFPKFDLQTLLHWVPSLQYMNLWQTFPTVAINIGYPCGQEGCPSSNKISCSIQDTERYSTHWEPRNCDYTGSLEVCELPAEHRWEMINCWELQCGLEPALLKPILVWFPQVQGQCNYNGIPQGRWKDLEVVSSLLWMSLCCPSSCSIFDLSYFSSSL